MDILKFVEGVGRESIQKSIAIVQARGNEGMYKCFSSCKEGAKAGNVLEMEEGRFSEGFNVGKVEC